MSDLPARYTIERVGAPDRKARHLGHANDGSLCWLESFKLANTFDSERDATSFKRNRLGDRPDARVVRHTVQ